MKKILIVGGVAGGATAAARLRRLNEEDQIILFEKDEYISFANCGLPYYIGNVIKQRENLLVQTVEEMANRFNIDVRNFSEVTAIDIKTKTLTVVKVKTNESYTESYDVLILSPGAKAIKPPIEGITEADNLFTLRNLPDTDQIHDYINDQRPATAVVVGGGFIGLEVAENLTERGVKVTIVEKMPQVMAPFDFEMAQLVHQQLNLHGIDLILNDGVKSFANNGRNVNLDSGKVLNTDMIILAIGVAPESSLAKAAGLSLGPKGHIVTTDQMRTIDAKTNEVVNDVYAIGDAVQIKDFVSKTDTAVALAWGANRQGRIVADVVNGIDNRFNGSMGTSALKLFNMVIASVGNNQRTLESKKIPFVAIHAQRGNHASYYPGATDIAMKLCFNPKTGEILGAQAIGQEGTEKRIDVIATAIKLKAKVTQLADLELSYAPPFSSAKDPTNILGYIAENIINGHYQLAYVQQIAQLEESNAYFLDVRTPFEFDTGHFKGAINIDIDQLRDRISEIKVAKDTPIYVNCQTGLRSYLAIMILRSHGFKNLYNVSGGYSTYKAYTYQLNTSAKIESVINQYDDISNKATANVYEIDVSGMQCPGPLLATYKAIQTVKQGEKVRITATDAGYTNDVKNWCETNGHTLVNLKIDQNKYIAEIIKGSKTVENNAESLIKSDQKNATIVLFSGELDKAIAAMIIAQGAAAQGKNVTIFFTFWGLNALRKATRAQLNKNMIEKMFGFMMPQGSKKLPLSNMNMLGMGPKMIKSLMKKKNVDQLEVMMANAQELGIKFIACTMSMDLMGIKKEELLDNIEYGGVGTYIASNENVGTTLFI